MNTALKKTLCALLVLTMLFGIAACGKDKDETTTTAPETTEETTVANDETQAPVNGETSEQTTAAVADTTAPQQGTTAANAPEETKPAQSEAPVSAKPTTKEEIVKYYETAVNKVKSQAKGVSKVYTNTVNYNNILDVNNNKALSGIASNLMNSFVKPDEKRYDYNGITEVVNHFPPRTIKTVKIDPAVIAEAKCDDKGTYYEVYIKANSTEAAPDVNAPIGGGKVGQFINVIDVNDITGAVSGIKFEGLENRYFDAWAKAKIDKATGNMTELETYLPSVMYFGEVKITVVSAKNISVGLAYTEKWTVNW